MKPTRKIKEIDPTVGRNIRLLRLKRGMTITDLANATDSDVGNISRLERAKQGYSDELLRKIADTLSVSVATLFSPDLPYIDASQNSDIKSTRLKPMEWEENEHDQDEFIEIPLLDIEFSAGVGRYELVDNSNFSLVFRRHFLHKKGVSINSAKLVRVSGTSMEPRLYDGDVVGIDTDDTRIRDGKAYGIRHGDLLRIKFLIEQPDGGIIIRSMNREEFPDEILKRDDRNNNLLILGKVFWSSSSW